MYVSVFVLVRVRVLVRARVFVRKLVHANRSRNVEGNVAQWSGL